MDITTAFFVSVAINVILSVVLFIACRRLASLSDRQGDDDE